MAIIDKLVITGATGALGGALLGSGAVPGAIFLLGTRGIDSGIQWLGHKILKIPTDFAPRTFRAFSMGLSIFTAMKLASLGGFIVPTGAAMLNSLASYSLPVGAVLGISASAPIASGVLCIFTVSSIVRTVIELIIQQ